ncbi:MAG: transporter permease subunit [Geminicoccaceae bacterium]|nr:transporter permease subunit [Geminicoccaceae bacterium]
MSGLLSEPRTEFAPDAQADPLGALPLRAGRAERVARVVAPLAIGLAALACWEFVVRVNDIPHYILPGPLLVLQSLVADWGTLWPSLLITLQITFMALAVATVGGVGLAILFTTSKWIELSFFPFAVILQVTPIIAIAPLILIYVDNTYAALLICAWIVAFFPILANTTLGLNSADHNLVDLFQLYGASRWQTLLHLRLPAAMPYRAVADRRDRRRVRRRHRRHRLGPRLPHPRGGLPPQHPAHVRSRAPDLGYRRPDLHGLEPAVPPGPAPLARERGPARAVSGPGGRAADFRLPVGRR